MDLTGSRFGPSSQVIQQYRDGPLGCCQVVQAAIYWEWLDEEASNHPGPGLGLFGAAAYAQSMKRIEVNVPFEFVAGDETLPPGDYALEQVFSGVLSVREVDGRASVMVRREELQIIGSGAKPALAFVRFD